MFRPASVLLVLPAQYISTTSAAISAKVAAESLSLVHNNVASA